MNRRLWRNIVNNVMLSLTGVCAAISVSCLFLILAYLVYNGWTSVNIDFFTKLPRAPGEDGGGMANAIVGSAQLVAIASAIGIPLGFVCGVYLAEWGRGPLPFFIRYACDLLNGVPSIVVGMFAWAVVVVPMRGFSALAGAVALAVILLPVVARATEQFLRDVPDSLREASLALGATKWRTVATVVVPAARKGILTGAILGVARIAGESAPLLFTAFNNQFWSTGLREPVASLPVMIYTHATAPYDDWHRQAWAAGLVLLLLVLVSNITTRAIMSRGQSGTRG